MVGQRLNSLLQQSGLETEDVPKVVGTFVTAKYCTYAAAVALGVRYQPLRRIFLTRQQALGGETAGALRPWAARQHRKILEALDRARNARLRETKVRFGQALDTARSQYQSARCRYRDAKGRWNSAGRELLKRQQQMQQHMQLQALKRREQVFAGGWYAWTSARYWQLSDKLEKAAASSLLWRSICSAFHISPRVLALGFAEGTILNKLLFPLYAPLQLWLIVQLFRHRRHAARLCCEEASAAENHSASTEAGLAYAARSSSRGETPFVLALALAAAQDAEELARSL